MLRTRSEIENEILKETKKVNQIKDEIRDFEETRAVKMYRSALEEYNLEAKKIKELEIELSEAKMRACKHVLVIVPKHASDKIPEKEVALYCLECGVSNSSVLLHKVNYDTRIKILNSTLHYGRLVWDGVVTDLDYAMNTYYDLKQTKMDENDLRIALKDFISAHEEEIKNMKKNM